MDTCLSPLGSLVVRWCMKPPGQSFQPQVISAACTYLVSIYYYYLPLYCNVHSDPIQKGINFKPLITIIRIYLISLHPISVHTIRYEVGIRGGHNIPSHHPEHTYIPTQAPQGEIQPAATHLPTSTYLPQCKATAQHPAEKTKKTIPNPMQKKILKLHNSCIQPNR